MIPFLPQVTSITLWEAAPILLQSFTSAGWVAYRGVQYVLVWIRAKVFGFFLERVAGFKQISIEPPRSSVHHVEEEGEGFCEQQKWNQEIGPKVLNFHPRSLNCPECTLLPKVIFLFFFVFTDTAREYRWAPVKQSSCWPAMDGQPYSVSWISVVLTHYDTMWRVTFAHFCWCCGEVEQLVIAVELWIEFVLHFLCQVSLSWYSFISEIPNG